MASNLKISDVLRPFDGEGDIIEWLNKVELIAKLRKLTELETVIPLFLENAAFQVYNELSDSDKADVNAIKSALIDAFALNSFQAYERFTKRVWCDEPVDVFVTDLRKLARLAGVLSDRLLLNAFIVGLPAVVSRELRAVTKIESLALSEVVSRARSLMAELVERPISLGAAGRDEPRVDRPRAGIGQAIRCFRCGGPHLMRACPSKGRFTCWTCGQEGHISKNCQGNTQGGSGAPAVPPVQD